MLSRGFNLIELVVVIVILSVIAAIGIPVYYNMESESYQKTADSIAASLTTASARNYRFDRIGSSRAVDMANCTDTSSLLEGRGMPSGYTITSAALTDGEKTTCTVTAPDGTTTSNFVAVGVTTS